MAAAQTPNPRIQLTKIADNIQKAQKSFTDAYTAYTEFKVETLLNLDREVEAKQESFKLLKNQLVQAEKDLQIEIDQRLKEYGLKAAEKVAKEQGRVLVEQKYLDDVEKASSDAGQKLEVLEVTLKKDAAADKAKAISSIIREKELEHAASSAQNIAKISQLEAQLQSANETIMALRQEVDKQRELSQKIAEAGKQGAIVQNMGKN